MLCAIDTHVSASEKRDTGDENEACHPEQASDAETAPDNRRHRAPQLDLPSLESLDDGNIRVLPPGPPLHARAGAEMA